MEEYEALLDRIYEDARIAAAELGIDRLPYAEQEDFYDRFVEKALFEGGHIVEIAVVDGQVVRSDGKPMF